MAKPHRWLYREVTRHTLASFAAGVIAVAALLVAQLITQAEISLEGNSAIALTLVFGAYGPAFLVLSHLAFRGLDGDRLRARLSRSDERSGFVRFVYLGGPKSWAATIVTVGVISVVLLATGGQNIDFWLILVCLLGVAGTWVLLVAIFAVEHMRLWAEQGGLEFPGEGERAFSDFVYLSIQLSTTFGSADVALTSRAARSLASVQSIVGFAYSTAIIAVFASLLITLTA